MLNMRPLSLSVEKIRPTLKFSVKIFEIRSKVKLKVKVKNFAMIKKSITPGMHVYNMKAIAFKISKL